MTTDATQERKWDDVTSEQLFNIIEYLKSDFDRELSFKVIELFNERMRDDVHVDSEILYSFMKYVFARIVAGQTADQAFGLKARKGKYRRPDTTSRDVPAVAMVVLQTRKDVTWEGAVSDAAEHLAIGDRTVERACTNYREGLEYLSEEILEQLPATTRHA